MDHQEFKMLQALPLDVKEQKSLLRIEEFIYEVGAENIYTSFSGGKDSTLLAHLVGKVSKRIPKVFDNTGMEFPEIREFASAQDNVTVIKPNIKHEDVIIKYGYPATNKNVADILYKLQHHVLQDYNLNYMLYGDERGKKGMLPYKYRDLLNADFQCGAGCCNAMKKKPFHEYASANGKTAFFSGELACESNRRMGQYLKNGCNAFDRKGGAKSTPLGFWTENDVLQYLKFNNIEICSIYGEIVQTGVMKKGNVYTPIYATTGYDRTGCVFCAFGANGPDADRFVRLAKTHPKLYDYCMRGGKYDRSGKWIPHKGLGMRHVLEVIKALPKKGKCNDFDFSTVVFKTREASTNVIKFKPRSNPKKDYGEQLSFAFS